MKKIIGVNIDGVTVWHAKNIGPTDHDTMCGIDADDPILGHLGSVLPPQGTKIDCSKCKFIFIGFRRLGLRKSNFET